MATIVRFALPLFFFILAGCETIHYEYHPPVSDQGKTCVTQCAAIKELCKGNEIQRAQGEKDICERSSASDYRTCMHKAKNKDDEKACDRKKKSCWQSENFYTCEADYRRCFVNCGGRIREYKE